MRPSQFLFGVLLSASVSALAVAAQVSAPATGPAGKSAPQKSQPQTDGERVFKQNCFRCHTEPEGFSPSIAGTIVRHMRVRASLSQRDEEQLLKFLNP